MSTCHNCGAPVSSGISHVVGWIIGLAALVFVGLPVLVIAGLAFVAFLGATAAGSTPIHAPDAVTVSHSPAMLETEIQRPAPAAADTAR